MGQTFEQQQQQRPLFYLFVDYLAFEKIGFLQMPSEQHISVRDRRAQNCAVRGFGPRIDQTERNIWFHQQQQQQPLSIILLLSWHLGTKFSSKAHVNQIPFSAENSCQKLHVVRSRTTK